MPSVVSCLGHIIHRYDIILCDIWGTLHNGETGFPESLEALIRAREEGIFVALITNSPMPAGFVRGQVLHFGIEANTYDQIITSGDCAYTFLDQSNFERVYHIGSARDQALFASLDIDIVDEPDEAEAIVVSGFGNDKEETPDDYLGILDEAMHVELPMVCVNPDVYIHVGSQKRWCAGALAKLYQEAGGEVIYTGKPYPPIFQSALVMAEDMLGIKSKPERTLIIGDNPNTDFQGAIHQEFDFFLVGEGISSEGDITTATMLEDEAKAKALVGRAPQLNW